MREFPDTGIIEENEIYSVNLKIGSSSYSLLLNLPPTAGSNSPPILFCDPVIPNHPMISKDGSVLVMEGMGIDGDLAGIFRRIQQEANRNVHSASFTSTATANTDTSCTTTTMPFRNKYNLYLNLIESLTEEQVKNLLSDEEKFGKFLINFKPILDEKAQEIEERKGELKEKARANINFRRENENLAIIVDSAELIKELTFTLDRLLNENQILLNRVQVNELTK